MNTSTMNTLLPEIKLKRIYINHPSYNNLCFELDGYSELPLFSLSFYYIDMAINTTPITSNSIRIIHAGNILIYKSDYYKEYHFKHTYYENDIVYTPINRNKERVSLFTLSHETLYKFYKEMQFNEMLLGRNT